MSVDPLVVHYVIDDKRREERIGTPFKLIKGRRPPTSLPPQ